MDDELTSPTIPEDQMFREGVAFKRDRYTQPKKKRGPSWHRAHRFRRDGKESVCSCGKRWPANRPHP